MNMWQMKHVIQIYDYDNDDNNDDDDDNNNDRQWTVVIILPILISKHLDLHSLAEWWHYTSPVMQMFLCTDDTRISDP